MRTSTMIQATFLFTTVLLAGRWVATAQETEMPTPETSAAELRKMTPLLTVDAIEPCLEFWCGRLGWTKTMEVPAGDQLGFAALQLGSLELMLQTRASVEADNADVAAAAEGATTLYVEVADLADIERRLAAGEGVEILVPRRKTFYGAWEVFARTPGGHIVGFAEFEREE